MARRHYTQATGDATATTGPANLHAVLVTTATATNVIEIEDGVGGTVVLSIPASTAANSRFDMDGIYMANGIHIDFVGTGGVQVVWSGA